MRPASCVRSFAVFLAVLAMMGGGCLGRSDPPRYYSLTAVSPDQVILKRSNAASTAVIGVGPVKLADYLDQSLLVTRTADNQAVKAEFDRWVGSLKDNVTNVLADNIGTLLGTDRIYLYPWRVAVPIDYQVVVDITRCDGRLGDAAFLEARWTVFAGPEKKLVKMSRASLREPATGPDYAALVAAQSRAVAHLSQEIAKAITAAGKE